MNPPQPLMVDGLPTTGGTDLTRRRFMLQTVAVAAAPWVVGRSALGAAPAPMGALRESMRRVSKCCLAWLNPGEGHLPIGGYEIAHDTGRWWDAMLRHEAVTGERIPADIDTAMLTNLRTLTGNPAALLASDVCNPHNLRESMLAYTALVRHRQNDWAKAQGRRLVETIRRLMKEDGQLDYHQLAELVGKPLTADTLMMQSAPAGQWFDATASTGRAIEAIVWFHEATGDDAVMDLASRLARVHLRQTVEASGKVPAAFRDPNHIGHTHSYCGTLRGLLIYGLAAGDNEYIDAVAHTYREGIWGTLVSHSGWTPHDLGKLRFPTPDGDPVGEHGSCSDVTQLALWLGLRAGQTDLLDDTERLLRARLFPSQSVNPDSPRDDGAWGVYSHPFGYGNILDVFAAVLHCLCDVYERLVTTSDNGNLSINLHFDFDSPQIAIRCERAEGAALHITPKQPTGLRVRVPAWASRRSVRLSSMSDPLPERWDGSYLILDAQDVHPAQTITLHHDLPAKQTVEELPVSRHMFALSWRGDEVIGCDPNVPIYPARRQ